MIIHHFVAGRINPDQADGIQVHTFEMARAQAALGHDVHVIGISYKATSHEMHEREGVRIHTFPTGRHRLRVHDLVRAFISDHRAEIAHIQVPLAFELSAVGQRLRQQGIPYVLSTHALWAPMMLRRKRWRKLAYRHIFDLPLARGALAIHATAFEEVNDILRYAPGVSVFVVPNALDVQVVDAAKGDPEFWYTRVPHTRKDSIVWCFLGRLDIYQKGLDLLLEAWSIAREERKDLQLFLIGPFWKGTEPELRALILKLSIQDSVHFVGQLNGESKYAALKSASFYIQTSRFETTPYSIQEALACRLPVVVTEGTNFGPGLRDYSAGLCEPFDAQAVARAILHLSRLSLEERIAMGERARRLIEDRHSLKRAAEHMTRTYEQLLASV